MSANSFGLLFRMTTWGESHGLAIGCIVDGVPACIKLSETDIQPYLNRRKPGQSRHTSQRREADKVRILSGVFEGKTTGAPVSLMIENIDTRSRDYSAIKDAWRPGHADYTYDQKYHHRDYRGGGRASARETAMRVAAGAIARKVLGAKVQLRGAVIQLGEHKASKRDWGQAQSNPLACPDSDVLSSWEQYLDAIRKQGSSIGAIIEIQALGVPCGLGAPVYSRLDADIAQAMMSIPAVKAVEIGAGFSAVAMRGEDHGDKMCLGSSKEPDFQSNHAGGILGGISTGQDIIVRFAVKPTSSILKEMPSLNRHSKEINVVTRGRHDPCVGIRAVPIGEAMLALVLADHLLRNRSVNLL